MAEERRTAAHYWVELDAPCEVRLKQLARDYNALADRWEEEHELVAFLREAGDELALAVDEHLNIDECRSCLEQALAAYRSASPTPDAGEE